MHIENRTLLPTNIISFRSLRVPPEDSSRFWKREAEIETCTMTASPSPVDFREMDVSPNNELLLADEQQMTDIFEPHHNDVLCGRGVTTNRHPGNESFRRLVSLNKVRIVGIPDSSYDPIYLYPLLSFGRNSLFARVFDIWKIFRVHRIDTGILFNMI
jgi:hypothetical protein